MVVTIVQPLWRDQKMTKRKNCYPLIVSVYCCCACVLFSIFYLILSYDRHDCLPPGRVICAQCRPLQTNKQTNEKSNNTNPHRSKAQVRITIGKIKILSYSKSHFFLCVVCVCVDVFVARSQSSIHTRPTLQQRN